MEINSIYQGNKIPEIACEQTTMVNPWPLLRLKYKQEILQTMKNLPEQLEFLMIYKIGNFKVTPENQSKNLVGKRFW